MKIIAFYLPQFHAIPENDQWWEPGFTEWTNVKKSKPQFNGHRQPEVPYKNHYYNLLDENTQINQARLAKEYGVYGFCYYHYWFEGKLLLEKPMENMLANSKIDIPFCICWANETWARTWDGQEKKVLIKQSYNEDSVAWKEHFLYLLPFFQDSRYIKINGKPFVTIYKPQLIENLSEMIQCWRKLALDMGLDGLHIGYQHHSAFNFDFASNDFDFAIEFEPFYTVDKCNKKGVTLESLPQKIKKKLFRLPTVYNYDFIWDMIIQRKSTEMNRYPGAFVAWDNTPRRGKDAIVFWEATTTKFKRYFSQRVLSAKDNYCSEFIFLNAWNEWAEGAHLEPNATDKFGYLEGVREALGKINE